MYSNDELLQFLKDFQKELDSMRRDIEVQEEIAKAYRLLFPKVNSEVVNER